MTDITDKSYDGTARRLEDMGDGTYALQRPVENIDTELKYGNL